ncbi:MAG: hypothetical protein EHM42_09915 [Planctomycetaceae bacterium]|nr:MAG: hypothetical protein EHM42_09915 [Planctomycetaceae bacterium]
MTEIRLFGKDSIQVARRLRAMLENLIEVLPEQRLLVLRHELSLLDKTALTGKGTVMLAVDGPIEEIELKDDRLLMDGPFVIARTDTIKFTMRWPAQSLTSYLMSGEKLSHCYEGSGRMLVCWTPYWRLMLMRRRESETALAD